MDNPESEKEALAEILSSLPTSCSERQKLLVEKLVVESDQGHLFAGWTSNGESDKNKKAAMLEQLQKLDQQYPGGISQYVTKAKDLLAKSKRGENPFEGYTPQVPLGVKLPFGSSEYFQSEKEGGKQFKYCACVLVAGGLGERLGFSGIKVALPSEVTTSTSFLRLYANQIRAMQVYNGETDVKLPFAIMTSEDTHDKTLKLLIDNDYFGLDSDQVVLMKQEKVPSLIDDKAHIALDEKNQYKILTKPHGHGDVHLLIKQLGLARKWNDEGLRWVIFFQDTNPMAWRTIPAALGVSADLSLEMNSVAVPRKAKAAAGAIMRLSHEDGHEMTINVEYNYIDSLLKATINSEGDVNGGDGFSPFPGNANQLILALAPYVEALEKSGGVVGEFVNPKYTDESRTKFKKPTRLECMMQDYPIILKDRPGEPAKVGVTIFGDQPYEETLTHRMYAPCKNNLKEAAKNASNGIPDASAASSELAIYALNSCMLRSIGAQIGDPVECIYGGITQTEWPHIVFSPSFATTYSDLHDRFLAPDQVVVNEGSTLVLDGPDIRITKLELTGTLVVRAEAGCRVHLEDVTVVNEGWEFQAITENDVIEVDSIDETDMIRGYRLIKRAEGCILEFRSPGEHNVVHHSQSQI
uniref:UTP-monosaccharide-1-phosphate uridylyltransferase n=1 Tax=Aplanochytrium stocchinoi TaxID=215587 RepID=A0A7S3PEE9_9STRA